MQSPDWHADCCFLNSVPKFMLVLEPEIQFRTKFVIFLLQNLVATLINLIWICFAVAQLLLLYSPDFRKLQTNLNSKLILSNDILIISLRNLMLLVPKIF